LHAAVLAVTFWFVWEARNEARMNVIKPDPRQTCAKILAYVELMKLHLLKEPSVNRRESKAPSMWTPPPPGVFLVNADAAIYEDAGKMGAGVVVCVAACRHHMPGLALPEQAEALALQWAVHFAQEESFAKVIFASDCLSLVQRL
jgi:hypothetical protein